LGIPTILRMNSVPTIPRPQGVATPPFSPVFSVLSAPPIPFSRLCEVRPRLSHNWQVAFARSNATPLDPTDHPVFVGGPAFSLDTGNSPVRRRTFSFLLHLQLCPTFLRRSVQTTNMRVRPHLLTPRKRCSFSIFAATLYGNDHPLVTTPGSGLPRFS